MSKQMGAPIKLDMEKDRQLKAICRMKPTLHDCAAFLDLHPSTVEKYIRRNYDQTFSEFRAIHMVHTRFSVIRALMKAIDNGNIKAIEIGLKYFHDWKDGDSDQDNVVNVYLN